MSGRDLDVDIVFDYLVNGDSQQTIADRYNFNQRDISNILTKDYGLNKGNVAWGTGKANQKGQYSHLSYEDIQDFVYSGSNDIDEWLANRYGNDDDDYEDDYDDCNDENNFDNIHINHTPGNPGYGDTRPQYDYRPRRTNYGNSFNLFDLFNGRFGDILFLVLLVAVLSVLVKIKAIIQVFPEYLELLWDGNYVYMMVGLALINMLVRMFVNHEPIGEILNEPRIYYWLGTGCILAGAKLLFDMGFTIIWPGALPIALGLGIIIFIKWLDNH